MHDLLALLTPPPDLAIAVALVVLFAWDRFNTPRTNRSMTTAFKYHLAAIWYVLTTLSLFALAVKSPDAVHNLLDLKGGDGTLAGVSTPLVAALLLTTLLPTVPLLRSIDGRLRRTFQRMAAIPREVRDRSGKLKSCAFRVPEDSRQAVRDELARSKEIDQEDVVFDLDGGATDEARETRYLWTKASAILLGLRSDPRFAGFRSDHPRQVERIRNDYEQLQLQVKLVFKLERESRRPGAQDSPLDRTLASARAELRTRCRHLLEGGESAGSYVEGLYDLTVRAVLRVFPREESRRQYLRSLGFVIDPSGKDHPGVWVLLDQVAALFLTLVVALLAGTFLLASSGASTRDQLVRVLMVSTILTVSVLCALAPKQWWAFARPDRGGLNRPWLSYLLAAAAASGLSVPVGFLFKVWEHGGDFDAAWAHQVQSLPWLLFAATLAVVTSFAMDDSPDRLGRRLPVLRRLDRHGLEGCLRLLEAIVTGAALGGAAVLVHRMLPEDARHAPMVAMAVFCALIGALLGFVVPHWYRNLVSGASATEEEGAAEGGAPLAQPLSSPP